MNSHTASHQYLGGVLHTTPNGGVFSKFCSEHVRFVCLAVETIRSSSHRSRECHVSFSLILGYRHKSLSVWCLGKLSFDVLFDRRSSMDMMDLKTVFTPWLASCITNYTWWTYSKSSLFVAITVVRQFWNLAVTSSRFILHQGSDLCLACGSQFCFSSGPLEERLVLECCPSLAHQMFTHFLDLPNSLAISPVVFPSRLSLTASSLSGTDDSFCPPGAIFKYPVKYKVL